MPRFLKSRRPASDTSPMRIITVEDAEFNALLQAWKQGLPAQARTLKIVCGTSQFMLALGAEVAEKILIKPLRGGAGAPDLQPAGEWK